MAIPRFGCGGGGWFAGVWRAGVWWRGGWIAAGGDGSGVMALNDSCETGLQSRGWWGLRVEGGVSGVRKIAGYDGRMCVRHRQLRIIAQDSCPFSK